MSFSISGKTAIVTGAANGIGLAIARRFIAQGANVMCADMDEDLLRSKLSTPGDDKNIQFFAGDLRQRLTTANLVSATVDAYDNIDILINASRQVMQTDALNVEDTSVETLIEQNLLVPLRLTQAVSRRMIRQAEVDGKEQVGSIVNIGSIAAHRGQSALLGYSVACAGLEQMTRSMALILAEHRIRINAVAFGSIMSHSLKTAILENDGWRQDIESHTPLRRIASPAELADTAQFLASEGASFITGEVITVDGGRSLLDAVSVPAH